MAKKDPLYPHVPKSKEAQFPHRTSGESPQQTSEVLPDGQLVLLKSGTQGWIKGQIVEYFDVIPVVGGMMYGGGMTPGYKVHILEGKHAGDTIRVPMNYVEPVKGSKYPVHPSSQSMGPYRGIKGSPKTPGGGIIFGSQKPYTPSPWR